MDGESNTAPKIGTHGCMMNPYHTLGGTGNSSVGVYVCAIIIPTAIKRNVPSAATPENNGLPPPCRIESRFGNVPT